MVVGRIREFDVQEQREKNKAAKEGCGAQVMEKPVRLIRGGHQA